ncbi:MAG: hypothetical protein ABIK65_05090 [Candidatus Eisenbacteria bacterium]
MIGVSLIAGALLLAPGSATARTPAEILEDRSAWEIPPGSGHDEGRTGDVLLLLNIDDIDLLWEFVEEWELAGARFPHVYPPNLLIGDLPEAIESEIRRDSRVAEIHRGAVREGRTKAAAAWNTVIESWNAEGERAASPGKLQDPPPLADFRDALFPNPVDPGREGAAKSAGDLTRRYGSAFGATQTQSSELILGKVAVAVVLPDAPGGAYADNEIPVVVAEARAAMDFWATEVRYPGVRFVYDIKSETPTSRNFHETPPDVDNDVWVNEMMNQMGYDLYIKPSPGSPQFGPVYEYLDSLRTRTRSEWGIVFFIPKAASFVGAGYTAYAYLGGPFLVCPSGTVRVQDGTAWVTRGSGGTRLSHLIIHESGHLFWALDEYPPGAGTPRPCSAWSGYLAIGNKNSRYHDYHCDQHRVGCCMDNPAAQVCMYTLGMMGSWDSPENPRDPASLPDGIPDILDTHPYATAESLPDTITTIFPTIQVIAGVMPVSNRAEGSGSGRGKKWGVAGSRPDITFNTIDHVVYRIDDTTDEDGNPFWYYADPEGGFGDEATLVNFSFVPDSLTGGNHRIRIKAINSVGNWSANRTFDQTIFVKAIALHDFAAEPDYGGAVRLSYRIRGGVFGATARLYRRDLSGVEEMVTTFPLEDNSVKVLLDGDQTPGKAYTYRLEASALGESWNWEASVTGPAPIARGEHISRITPNPFRESTMISVRVPRGSLSERRAGGGGKPGGTNGGAIPPSGEGAPSFAAGASSKYNIVRVEVDIYNLAGRRVRHFHPIHAYEGFYADPFYWDGTDDQGRRLSQGIYFVRMKAGDNVWETRKVMLLY